GKDVAALEVHTDLARPGFRGWSNDGDSLAMHDHVAPAVERPRVAVEHVGVSQNRGWRFWRHVEEVAALRRRTLLSRPRYHRGKSRLSAAGVSDGSIPLG